MLLNVTRQYLKPTGFTLETFLPITSIQVWWLRRPEMAEYMEVAMGATAPFGCPPARSGREPGFPCGSSPSGGLPSQDHRRIDVGEDVFTHRAPVHGRDDRAMRHRDDQRQITQHQKRLP